jgi:serpin B
MVNAFDCKRADFSKLLARDYTREHPICVSKVAQRTFVEVNEVGTEAAAVTEIALSLDSVTLKPPPLEFIVDRPFIVAIRDDRTGLLLFLGQITDPLQP